MEAATQAVPFSIGPAKYAKGCVAVRCVSDGDWKTRAMRLCCALRGRYSGRENAYIMSPTKGRRLVELYEGGWDAEFVSADLIPPREGVANDINQE